MSEKKAGATPKNQSTFAQFCKYFSSSVPLMNEFFWYTLLLGGGLFLLDLLLPLCFGADKMAQTKTMWATVHGMFAFVWGPYLYMNAGPKAKRDDIGFYLKRFFLFLVGVAIISIVLGLIIGAIGGPLYIYFKGMPDPAALAQPQVSLVFLALMTVLGSLAGYIYMFAGTEYMYKKTTVWDAFKCAFGAFKSQIHMVITFALVFAPLGFIVGSGLVLEHTSFSWMVTHPHIMHGIVMVCHTLSTMLKVAMTAWMITYYGKVRKSLS